jgi:hypothetical protein
VGEDALVFVQSSASQAADPREVRGVANPRVVDLIGLDAERDEVYLVMLEERSWGTDPGQLRQLENKFNSYLDYLLDGHLAAQYPQYEGRRVRFQLDCVAPPGEDMTAMLTSMRNFAKSEGIRFSVNVLAAEGSLPVSQ